MLKVVSGSLAAGLLLFWLIAATGNLVWDNKLLWGPPTLFFLACCLGLTGLEQEEHRAPLLLLAAVAFCCMLAYGVFYFFLFGLVGH